MSSPNLRPSILVRHLRRLGARECLRRCWQAAPWQFLAWASRHAAWVGPGLGAAAYRLWPDRGRPLNGQCARETLVRELLGHYRPAHIIETGTFRGATTEFFASQPAIAVWSCELVSAFHHYAKRRLRKLPHVHLAIADSRSYLAGLAAAGQTCAETCFFYLDAHWYQDLPLAAEIRTICQHWPDAVIVIDDFRVPGDAGYQYDDYGPAGALALDAIEPAMRDGFEVYFPRLGSDCESGAKRGCVVLASGSGRAATQQCVMLRPDAAPVQS